MIEYPRRPRVKPLYSRLDRASARFQRVVMISTLLVLDFGRPSWVGVDGGLTGLSYWHFVCGRGGLGNTLLGLKSNAEHLPVNGGHTFNVRAD